VSDLEKIAKALASIQNPTVAEYKRAFNYEFKPEESDSKPHWGASYDPYIDSIYIRSGAMDRSIVVNFKKDKQKVLAEEVKTLGPVEDFDIVSPPVFSPLPPAKSFMGSIVRTTAGFLKAAFRSTPKSWSRKWSAAYNIADAKIWFGFEEINGSERLISASRSFKTNQSGENFRQR
jgi:hypothetical protein